MESILAGGAVRGGGQNEQGFARVEELLNKILFWAWFGVISVVSLLSGEAFDNSRLMWTASGWLEHFLGYGVLGFLALRAFAVWRAVLVLTVVFGISVGFEGVQVLYLGRVFDYKDLMGNGLGIVAGAVVGKVFRFKG